MRDSRSGSAMSDSIELVLRANEQSVAGDGGAGEGELAEAVPGDLVVLVAGVDHERVAFLAEEEDLAAVGPRRRGERVADAADARLVDFASALRLEHLQHAVVVDDVDAAAVDER